MLKWINIITLAIIVLITGACKMQSNKTVELTVESDPTISLRIWINTGSQYDPAGKEGLAYITAKMISEASTAKYSYEEILEKLFPLAAEYGTTIDKEQIVFYGRVHKEKLSPYYLLFKQALLEPAFKQEDLNRIKDDVLNTLQRSLRYNDDEELGKAALNQAIFTNTPYGHDERGTVEAVKSITVEDVRSFYNTYFNRENIILGIGGGYSPEFKEQVESDLKSMPEGITSVKVKISPEKKMGIHVLLVEKDVVSTAISFGYPLNVLRGDKDFYALALANSWLGEHRNSSSHLYQVIREARGMNYGDYSYIENYPNGGRRQFPMTNVGRHYPVFQIWIRPVPNEQAHFALRAAMRELQILVENGMSREEFELTRSFLKKYILHYAPTTMTQLGYKLDDVFFGLKTPYFDQFSKALDNMTLEDVNEAIKKHLQYKNIQIAMVTANAEQFKDKLVGNAVSQMNYSSPKSPEIMKEDKEIEIYPLDINDANIEIIKIDEMFQK
ncbi:MAG: M16 family metallopeptidase [Calditrichaceae bacterium]